MASAFNYFVVENDFVIKSQSQNKYFQVHILLCPEIKQCYWLLHVTWQTDLGILTDLWCPSPCDLHRSLPLPHEQHRRKPSRHRRSHLEVNGLSRGALPHLARLDRCQRRALLRGLVATPLDCTSSACRMKWRDNSEQQTLTTNAYQICLNWSHSLIWNKFV